MITFRHKIENDCIANRPSGILVCAAQEFEADIRIRCNERAADAKRLYAVMSLGARHGDEITFEVNGRDEAEAARCMAHFCGENAPVQTT